MKIKKLGLLSFLFIITSCSSAPEKPTKDICSIKKHWKDNIFQVFINDKVINERWYIFQEAIDVSKLLAKKNKCTRNYKFIQ